MQVAKLDVQIAAARSLHDDNARQWVEKILPEWEVEKDTPAVSNLLWRTIPANVRGMVWPQAIGNALQINAVLYAALLEQSERVGYHRSVDQDQLRQEADAALAAVDSAPPSTPPSPGGSPAASPARAAAELQELTEAEKLAMEPMKKSFGLIETDMDRTMSKWIGELKTAKSPVYDVAKARSEDGDACLKRVLEVYACYKPELGYVQGMSYLAAMLLLYTEPITAFICLANIMEKSCLLVFYRMQVDEMDKYFRVFEKLLALKLPAMYAFLTENDVSPRMYIVQWIFAVFSRSVPLVLSSALWDHFLVKGDVFLFRACIGLLKASQDQIIGQDFDVVLKTLNHLPLEDKDTDRALEAVKSIVISDELWAQTLMECG